MINDSRSCEPLAFAIIGGAVLIFLLCNFSRGVQGGMAGFVGLCRLEVAIQTFPNPRCAGGGLGGPLGVGCQHGWRLFLSYKAFEICPNALLPCTAHKNVLHNSFRFFLLLLLLLILSGLSTWHATPLTWYSPSRCLPRHHHHKPAEAAPGKYSQAT